MPGEGVQVTTMEFEVDDPFALAIDSKVARREEIITGGRYRLPHRDGSHKKNGWQRVTNLVGAYSDEFALRMWEIEQVLKGVAISEAVYAALIADMPAVHEMTKAQRKAWAEDFTERCKAITKADAGTRFGNHRHSMVEEHHEGLPMGHLRSDARSHLSLYRSALVRNGLRAVEGMQERRVLIEELEAVGTLDNVLEDLSRNVFQVGDLKTQKRFWTWLEIAAQEACYAHSDAVWDPERNCWADWPVTVDREVALVMWMPREHPSGEPMVDVYEVDIKAGWETARRAREVVMDRAAAKRKGTPRGWLRPAAPPTETERYAARFAACETVAEGSALVAEARKAGVWDVVLADCARDAMTRIKSRVDRY